MYLIPSRHLLLRGPELIQRPPWGEQENISNGAPVQEVFSGSWVSPVQGLQLSTWIRTTNTVRDRLRAWVRMQYILSVCFLSVTFKRVFAREIIMVENPGRTVGEVGMTTDRVENTDPLALGSLLSASR